MPALLRGRIPTWEEIRSVTRQPGISIGVIYQGQEILRHNAGVIDIETGRKPDSDTLYCIASLSKAFMAASLDILVRDGKTSWDTPVHSVVPDFRHTQKGAEFEEMTIRDICSHRTGLLSLDEVTQGLDGRILIDKKEVVKVCNAMPIKNSLRSGFLYNNGLFELAGHIVERLSGYPTWGDFQRDHIYDPLDMARTTAFRDTDDVDKNFAKPYMILTNGTPSYIPTTELSADSMNGGSGGVRSSVNDLLKWSHCLLASFGEDLNSKETKPEGILSRHSPIFNRCTIASPEDATAGDYCMGWCHHRTPAKLGLISPNRTLLSPTLGVESPSLLIYGHQGDVPGNTCNIYIIPDTKSAVVVLSNGTGLSDATDWIAQDIIQTISDLQPQIDFLAVSRAASQLYLSHFAKDFQDPLASHRGDHQSPLPDLSDFTGTYVMENLDVAFIKILLDSDSDSDSNSRSGLRMLVNGYEDQSMQLRHYNHDTFSYLPENFDECLKRGLDRTQWSAFLLRFQRNDQERVESILWALDGVDTLFKRARQAGEA
ncbi:beta-lactamase/transpeptidase-like protein [Cercophora newfieldiana]|uniref:Beta-lactamase/transpeptidase-like protein n=1 Tax=Cercophora newfieldiana TaxID=92897 RepID=A0AA39XXA5_9PEZI|nr:beta-lactamase/transpeptidase-like protein [Cercophora newfieldiana]